MLQQTHQAFLIHQRTGLQELAQLVHLDELVHFVEPVLGLFDRFFAGGVDAGFKIGAGFHFDGELARQFEIDGIEPPGESPLRGEILHGC